MCLIGERSGDCGGSLCELVVLMSVPSLQCEELQWRCLKIQTTECVCLSDYWPCASPPPLILCLVFFFCFFHPTVTWEWRSGIRRWGRKGDDPPFGTIVVCEAFLGRLIGHHSLGCLRPTSAKSPWVSRLTPEGRFHRPALRRWDRAICFRRHNPFNRLKTVVFEEYDPVIIWVWGELPVAFFWMFLRCHFGDPETVLSVQWSVLLHFLSKRETLHL